MRDSYIAEPNDQSVQAIADQSSGLRLRFVHSFPNQTDRHWTQPLVSSEEVLVCCKEERSSDLT